MIKTARRLFLSSIKICIKLTVTILFRLKQDKILSIFMGLTIILYNKNEIDNKKKTGILAIKKLIFNDDLIALKKYPSDYKILLYPIPLKNSKTGKIRGMWPEEIQEQTAFYVQKEKYRDLFERCSKLFYDTLKFIETFSQINVKIILTANIDYWQDYPWIEAIHKKNGKFVVLEKESILYSSGITNRRLNRYKDYKFKYEGDVVLFYNELAKESYLTTDSFKQNQSFVTGCPRVDMLTSLAEDKKDKNDFILFATFMSPLHGPYKSVKLGNDILNIINKDKLLKSKTIIKCKDSVEAKNIKKTYPDLHVVSDTIFKYLKKNPAIFIGYNSTSCFDSLIARIPTVVPLWGDAKKVGNDTLLGEHTSDFHLVAHDKEEFVKILKSHLDSKDIKNYFTAESKWDHSELKKKIETEYSPIDGKNRQRFFNVINRLNLK